MDDERARTLRALNRTLAGPGPRPAFPAGAQPGDAIAGSIVDVEQHHREERTTGRPLYWSDGRPQAEVVTTRPVMDHSVILRTDQTGPDDDGRRRLWIDQGVRDALRQAVAEAGGIEIGGWLAVAYLGDDSDGRRQYTCAEYLTARQHVARAQQGHTDSAGQRPTADRDDRSETARRIRELERGGARTAAPSGPTREWTEAEWAAAGEIVRRDHYARQQAQQTQQEMQA